MPLEHHAGGLLVGNPVGKLHGNLGRHHAFFGVGPHGHIGIANPVTHSEISDTFAHSNNFTSAFEAKPIGHGNGTCAGAEIDIDEVQTGSGLLHANFSGAWVTDLDLFPLHDFGTTGLVKTDCVNHDFPLEKYSER